MQLSTDLNVLYSCCDHEHEHKLAEPAPGNLSADLAAMLETIWQYKGMPDTINKEITTAFAKKLWSGVTEGYGSDFSTIDYDTPDHNMLTSLQKNVYAFSAAKNWQMMKAVTQALVSDDGKLRTYSEFKRAAFDITGEHSKWLKTEYDTAIASAQMASKWQDIQATKARLGILEFDAVMDRRTTDLCRGFDGVRLHVDDAFWKQYYPPNHFRCRSTVRQRAGGKATDSSKIVIPEGIPEMFKVNLGEAGLIFPPKHNYYIGLPPHVTIAGEDLIPPE